MLEVLDSCAKAFTFPMLDNGYVYLAATRLSVFGDGADWAIAIEIFGFSVRAGVPDLHVQTFSNAVVRQDNATATYAQMHPNDEYVGVYPLSDGPWIDGEHVASDATEIELRGVTRSLPDAGEYASLGIDLLDPDRVAVFELCRYLAAAHRDEVLATPAERRTSVSPDLPELLVLEDWRHPDLVNDELPSDTSTFRQLAEVAETGDVTRYRPTEEPNTHWRNWPDGGLL